jgi:hypothetical protein
MMQLEIRDVKYSGEVALYLQSFPRACLRARVGDGSEAPGAPNLESWLRYLR